uniref:Uncharacterized protein n=1 Tax=Globisporangium ultimum (strain ATCC 200006 / CBS 805.95 / DAOM BR144) TaxID=431595 RepID=K3WQK1_GLOUD
MRLECGESNRKMREYAATHFDVQNETILGKFHLRYASDYGAGSSRCRSVVEATRSIFLTVLCIDSVNDNGEPVDGYMIKDRI